MPAAPSSSPATRAWATPVPVPRSPMPASSTRSAQERPRCRWPSTTTGAVNVNPGCAAGAGRRRGTHIGSFDIDAGTVLAAQRHAQLQRRLGDLAGHAAGAGRRGELQCPRTSSPAPPTWPLPARLNLSANALSGGLQQSSGPGHRRGAPSPSAGPAAISFGGHSGVGTTRVQGATSITSTRAAAGWRAHLPQRRHGPRKPGNVRPQQPRGRPARSRATARCGERHHRAPGTSAVPGSTFVFASNQGRGRHRCRCHVHQCRHPQQGRRRNDHGVGGPSTTTGAVNVNQGVLALDEGGTHIGSFDIDAGYGARAQRHAQLQRRLGDLAGHAAGCRGGRRQLQQQLHHRGHDRHHRRHAELRPQTPPSTGSLVQSSGQVTGTNALTVVNSAAINFGGHSGAGHDARAGRDQHHQHRAAAGCVAASSATKARSPQTGNVDLNSRAWLASLKAETARW